jgi:hypothetical protein
MDRAVDAASGSLKNVHTWAPSPERERSRAAGTPAERQASR